MKKYVTSIYFEVDPNYIVDPKKLEEVISTLVEGYDTSIKVSDTHVEELDVEPTLNS